MTDIVKGMADVLMQSLTADGGEGASPEEAMRAALLFLADNVSDEMVHAYVFAPAITGRNVNENVRKSIVAAIRAAAGGEQTPPPKGEGS